MAPTSALLDSPQNRCLPRPHWESLVIDYGNLLETVYHGASRVSRLIVRQSPERYSPSTSTISCPNALQPSSESETSGFFGRGAAYASTLDCGNGAWPIRRRDAESPSALHSNLAPQSKDLQRSELSWSVATFPPVSWRQRIARSVRSIGIQNRFVRKSSAKMRPSYVWGITASNQRN